MLKAQTTYWSGYVGDTLTMDRLTFNLGVRYDQQYGSNQASVSPANPVFPDKLGDLSYPGGGTEFKWQNWQPRAGLTFAFGPQNRTLVKASYARYADQLGTANVSFDNPNGYYSILGYAVDDVPHQSRDDVRGIHDDVNETRSVDRVREGCGRYRGRHVARDDVFGARVQMIAHLVLPHAHRHRLFGDGERAAETAAFVGPRRHGELDSGDLRKQIHRL